MSQPSFDRVQVMKDLTSGRKALDDFSDPVVAAITDRLQLSREEFQSKLDDRRERDRVAPSPGDVAPDFKLELVDSKGARTGQFLKLSDEGERPVALIFGSYT